MGSQAARVRRDLAAHKAQQAAERSALFEPGSAIVGWCDGGEWAACFGLSLHNLFMRDFCSPAPRIMRDPDKRYYLRDIAGTMGIASARNRIATTFLDETDAEWLFMVDSDMGFEADTVDRLIESASVGEYEVMGALAFALKRRLLTPNPLSVELTRLCPTIYQMAELENEAGFVPVFDYPRDEVIQVGGTGAACVVIHRGALVRIRALYGDRWFEPTTHPTGDHGKPRTFSEDLSFCLRAQAAGAKVGVNTSVKTGHAKGGIFLTEEQYVIQRAVDEGLKVAEEEAKAQAWRAGNPMPVHPRQNGKTTFLEEISTLGTRV